MPDVTTEGPDKRLIDWYRRFAPLVHARATRLVGPDEADDVVQEVFIRLIDRPPSEGLSSWIYRTSTNLCLDRLRHGSRRDRSWREEVRQLHHSREQAGLEQVLGDRQLLLKLLAELDRRTQRVVTLIYFDEMTQREAAETLELSRKTVGKLLSRFTKKTQKMIERWQKTNTSRST